MYNIVYTTRMKHDAKLMQKRGKNMNKLVEVLNLLASAEPLPEKIQRPSVNRLAQRFQRMSYRTRLAVIVSNI